MATPESCGTCRFARMMPGHNHGECRYDPPRVLLDPQTEGTVTSYWPDVSAGDWCGKWQAPLVVRGLLKGNPGVLVEGVTLKIREKLSLSQQELADALGVAIRSVARWERPGARYSGLVHGAVRVFAESRGIHLESL